MFGYIRIYNNELKIKDIKKYKDCYCGLCTELGKSFGLLYRIFVSYDMTFFLLIFDALTERKENVEIICPLNVKKKKQFLISSEVMEYVSLVNLYAIMQKTQDDKIDGEYNLKNVAFKCLLNQKKVKKKISKYNDLFESWNDLMEKYFVAEKDSASDFDVLINSIGEVYGKMFSDYLNFAGIEADKKCLFDLGLNIGIYIYVMDAYDDYHKDRKKNRFNPIMKMNGYDKFKDSNDDIKRKISMIKNLLISKINNCALNLELQKKEHSEILGNIIVYGMNNTYNRITKEKYSKGDCAKCCK